MNERTIHRLSVLVSTACLVALFLWFAAWLSFGLGLVRHPMLGDYSGFLLAAITIVGGTANWVRWRWSEWRTDTRRPGDLTAQNEVSRSQPLWILAFSMVVPIFAASALLLAISLLFQSPAEYGRIAQREDIRILCFVVITVTAVYALAASSRLKPRDKWGRPEWRGPFRRPGRHHA